ncbi:MAG TPA: hypothetical protein VH596_14515 [Terriglobales bacterium]|jgi:adenosylhomocysteine nucleosidase
MAHMADLSPYRYGPAEPDVPADKLLAVGWLDAKFRYTKGDIAERDVVLRRLRQLAQKPVNITCGFHICEFCRLKSYDSAVSAKQVGNGEIRVKGANGVVYAAPVLIAHYIERHAYRPPSEFLEGLQGLPELRRIVIIAALKREIRPLVKNWSKEEFSHEGRRFSCYESDYAVVVCGGIGPEYSRRAAEAAVAKYYPQLLISAGIAGSAVPELHVGETIFPAAVVDTRDGSHHETAINHAALSKTPLARTVLASYPEIAGSAQKRQLAKSYGAHAVDMEGASVARAAQLHNLPFLAIKSISDELDVDISQLNRFIRGGKFATGAFVCYLVLRPWLWLKMSRLARNTQLASDNLCAWLRESALTNTILPGTEEGTRGDARASRL